MTAVRGTLLTLSQFKERFDPGLERVLDDRLKRARSVTSDRSIVEALEYAREVVLASGKRLRPYMAYLGCAAAGRSVDPALFRRFVGIEFFHLFCLLQDDVIDRSPERHGLRTLHEHLRGHLGQQNRVGDLRHIGQGEAMLVGDLFAAWAEELITDPVKLAPSKLKAASEVFYHMREEVILGQLLDVDTMTRPVIANALIRNKMVLKSAHYSFVRPMQFGIRLGGGGRALMSLAERFGVALGLAFQIQDDLLDVTGEAARIGKSVLSDIRQHQHTPLTQFVLTQGPYLYRKQLLHWFGGDVEPRDHGAIREMFERSGAIAAVTRQIEAELRTAEAALKSPVVRPAVRTALRELTQLVRRRVS